ncbi:cell wall hydrolase [Ignatzschineria ureiclastica]|uniref:N-acetylmuramoyl-L-alanine amidase AmiC n=1 Tax=Ignatzschineria ureiclastica TaxID=472582 RepID=A0A2U2ADC2_9GAMM|nr:N-acetylmuramoyl-L-alanine amidase [Ignatzschineria ureiclastica]PWD80662.1 cell wall hydrolase [Ignatzschineria ureiclastica]
MRQRFQDSQRSTWATFFSGIMMIILLLIGQSAFAATIVGTGKAEQRNGEMLITFPLSQQIKFNSFRLQNPHRLVIDIPNAQLQRKVTALPISSGVVAGVRLGTQQGTDLRIVVDLNNASVPASAAVIRGKSGYELVIAVGLSAGSVQQDFAASGQTVVTKPQEIQVAQSVPKKNILIVLDPGHGGKDPGAHGKAGTREKDVVLQIAKILQTKINQQPNMKAILTRNNDTFIPLRERVLIARRNKADMFISIHADAGSSKADGASVYILSTSGASSEAARLLAQAENQSDLIGGVKISDKDNAIASMLLDLSQEATIESSNALGKHILKNVSKHANLHKRQVERAGFAVLKAPDIPSVLVETGFISNPKEEQNLRSKKHQTRLAEDILQGIKDYYKERPATELVYKTVVQKQDNSRLQPQAPTPKLVAPKVTPQAEIKMPELRLESSSQGAVTNVTERSVTASVAEPPPMSIGVQFPEPSAPIELISNSTTKEYMTQRGESLADVARKYGISESALKRANNLPDNQLRVPVGTRLVIPQ